MRSGIDASRAFVKNPTGTERYSYEVITRILKLPEAKKHTWILYTKENIKLPYLWTQVGLAYRTWVDRLDVLWVPAHTLPVLRKPGIKTVGTIHGIEYEWLPAYENWLQRWYLPLSTRYAVFGADKVIAVSEFTKRQLVEQLGADPGKIDVIYEGVTTSPLTPLLNLGEGNQRGEVLKKYGLKPREYLMFIGTIQPRKNLERLIEAFRKLKGSLDSARDDKLRLVICGKWGWGYEKLQDVKDKNIIFTGYVNDEERWVLLKNALVYVQPSITEGFGLPVLEAMAAGGPVGSSNGGALVEVVGEAGMLFDPLKIGEMRDAIGEI